MKENRGLGLEESEGWFLGCFSLASGRLSLLRLLYTTHASCAAEIWLCPLLFFSFFFYAPASFFLLFCFCEQVGRRPSEFNRGPGLFGGPKRPEEIGMNGLKVGGRI